MKTNRGAAILIVVLFFVVLSTTLLTGVSNPVTHQIKNTSDFLKSKQSYSAADAQAENALYRLNKGKSDAPTIMSLLGATAEASIVDIAGEKEISIQGLSGDFKRFLKTRVKQDLGIAFNYGLQTGIGGLQMTGSSHIIGNVYSNGDIKGNGGPGWASTYITGSATAATLSNPTVQIENTGPSTPTHSYTFGTTGSTQDFSQSIVVSTTTAIAEIHMYIKKTGAPANASVKIVNNSSGKPGTTVIASGVLNSGLVTTSYSYVPIVMTTAPALVAGTTYWIVIDVATNVSNYYTVGLNNSTYGAGTVKAGVMSGTWNNISPTTADAYFKVFVGGDSGIIQDTQVGSVSGNAWSKIATNVIVSGSLYCQVGTGNNKVCDTSRSDPVAAPVPISDGNIQEWKDTATLGGSTSTITVGGASSKTMGPIKINGDLNVTNSGTLYITGPIYVTGNILTNGSAKIYVHSSLGSASEVIVADGTVSISGSGGIYGSGTAGSYMIVTSTNTSDTAAISISGSGGSVVLNAPYGTVNFSGSAGVKAVVAKKMIMSGNTEIVYDSGLADLDFTSGPSGSWNVDSWKEIPSL